MAHMIPENIPMNGPGAKAEQAVFDALMDSLSDDYFVYSRLVYVDDKKYTQGEADFLILHRTLGMLFLECKGSGVKLTGGGVWQREIGSSWEEMKESPFEQAERTKYELVDKLKPRLKKILPELEFFPFIHGHAVVFPFSLIDNLDLPLGEPRELFIDSEDLDEIEKKLKKVFNLWTKKLGTKIKKLEDWQFDKFRKKALHPKMHIVCSLGGEIKAETRAMLKLSREQVKTMAGMFVNDRLKVSGGAGTGKTVLAMEAAKKIAANGSRVLFLCYNKALRNYLRNVVGEDSSIDVQSFSALCINSHYKLNKGKIEIPTDKEAQTKFWDEEAPLILLEAIEAELIPRYDAIVIDEAQDFAEGWWAILDELLNNDGRMFAFYDPLQEIFERNSKIPNWPKFRLGINFRNTTSIANYLNELVNLQMETMDSAPTGEPPTIIKRKSKKDDIKKLKSHIEKLIFKEGILPDQITILTPHTKVNSTMASIDEIAGCKIGDTPSKRSGQILHTTIGAFKGLESDILFLLDIDPQDSRCNSKAQYVAASRARSRLFIFS